MSNRPSVLGVYFQGPPENRAEGTELVKNSAMRWVRWIDPDVRSPDNPFRGRQRVLARLYIPDSEEHYCMDNGVEGAIEYAKLMRPRIEKLKLMDIWDVGGPNEPHPTQATASAYNDFYLKLIDIYYGLDMKLWGWDWGVGWPGLQRFGDQDVAYMGMIQQFVGSIVMLQQAGGGLVVHEYNAPAVLNPDGNNENSRTLRIMHTLEELAEAGVDVDNLSVIIGECGICRAVIEGQPNLGWQSYSNWIYPPQYGLGEGVMNAERYWLQMNALDDEYVKVKQIEAAFPFITNPWGEWASFNWPGALIRRSVKKYSQPVTPEPGVSLDAVYAYLDKVPFTRKAAISLGLEFLDEVQVSPTEWMAVCVDRTQGKYVALPVKVVNGAWTIGEAIALDRPLVG